MVVIRARKHLVGRLVCDFDARDFYLPSLSRYCIDLDRGCAARLNFKRVFGESRNVDVVGVLNFISELNLAGPVVG